MKNVLFKIPSSFFMFAKNVSTLHNLLLSAFVLFYAGFASPAHAQWNHIGPVDKSLASNGGFVESLTSDYQGNVYGFGYFNQDNPSFGIGKWDSNHWSRVGDSSSKRLGFSTGSISCFDTAGNLFIATSSGNIGVAKWDGTTWSELGDHRINDTTLGIRNICADTKGNVYVMGSFLNKSTGNPYYLAKWDGSSWSEFGGTNLFGASSLNYLWSDTKGNVYIYLGSNGVNYVMKWDGSSWGVISSGFFKNATVSAYCTDLKGIVYASGHFSDSSGQYYVSKWDGKRWYGLSGLNTTNGGSPFICTDVKSNVYAAGVLDYANGVAKWNGVTWDKIGNLDSISLGGEIVSNIAADSFGRVYINLTNKYNSSSIVVKWDRNNWAEADGVGSSTANAPIYKISSDTKGNVYTAGTFTNSKRQNYISKWDGDTWGELKSFNGYSLAGTFINSLCNDSIGNLYASGYKNAQSNTYNFLIKWDGTNWAEVAGTNCTVPNGAITCMYTDAKGNMYAAGGFKDSLHFKDTLIRQGVAKWDGAQWAILGTRTILGGYIGLDKDNGSILTICSDANGNVYAAGAFYNSNQNYYVAEWDGSKWSELGGLNALAANNPIQSIQCDSKGNLYAIGGFTNSNGNSYIAKWDGSSWKRIGDIHHETAIYTFYGYSLSIDANDNVYAAGDFLNSDMHYYVAKWDGITFSELGTSALAAPRPINCVYADKASGRVFIATQLPESTGGRTWWAYYGSGIPTPLKLVAFAATVGNNAVNLQWQTANEVNTQSFAIECSSDGKAFAPIGSVRAKGSGDNSYAFIDIAPLQGLGAYRLKMQDKDGSFAYSKIIEVNLPIAHYPLSIYPNPAKDYAVLHFNQAVSSVSIAVYNASGQKVLAKELKGGTYNSYALPILHLTAGTYTVTMQTKGASYNSKLVVE
ncbi:T9SS type A sorting domain-containing protein [Parasediminibacterium sp. JCM 36343]|uniref:T9SS type A sorting domain-containing protein n=1 Tax=Parasediminibacterium sp. JCM 36343 TaxID=3374279 RepID=UPI00397DD331